VIFYALVADDCPTWAIDLWPTREQAEIALKGVLADEPALRELLRVEPVALGSPAGAADRN
jgi:hypothetical protein